MWNAGRLGLSHADFLAYLRALRTTHEVRVRVSLQTLDGKTVGSVAPHMLDGQVLGDRHHFGTPHGPTRRLTLSLLDPHNALKIDTASPDDGALYYDRMVRVSYGVRVPELGRFVTVPVFTGPAWKLQRTDDVVDIEADDPSQLGLGAAWRPLTIPKGHGKVDAIKRILTERMGVTRFAFPSIGTKLAHPVSLHRLTHPWAVAERIAHSMDLQLYFDGAGVCTMRRLPHAPCYTFNTGPGGEIVEPVSTDTSRDGFANVVQVTGRKPKGKKHRIRAVATAPHSHSLSPWRLAMNDVPLRVVKEVENDHIRSHKEAQRRAERILKDALRARVDVSLSVLPMPIFDPGDLVRSVTVKGDPVEHRMDTFTLPLGVDGDPSMAIGWWDKPAVSKRRIRR